MGITTISILIILFIATLIRSTFGFGESLIAVPLLVFFMPVEVAVPLSVLISITIAAIVVIQDHQQIHLDSAKWLIIFAIMGIPLGLFILIYGNEQLVKLGLGLLIIIYAMYSLFWKSTIKIETDKKGWLFICGFLSGIFGGAYGINGPPLVLYGNIRSWSAKHFRATLQAYFLVASIIGMFGYWYKGLWTGIVTYNFLIAIPVVVPAIFLGRYLNHRLKDDSFFKYIYYGLIGIGIILLVQFFNNSHTI
jgi:uncharacterized membrane protein YfcA